MSRDWIPSYIKDTTNFLQQPQILDHIPDSAILVTMDVTSLYTNIPHNEGINSVANILKLSGHNKDFIDEIKSCIYFILKNNVVTFNEENYIQVSGTAMGTKMVPKYANSFTAEVEKSLFASLNRLPIYKDGLIELHLFIVDYKF